MAVYTQLGAEALAEIIAAYRCGRAGFGQGHRRGHFQFELADRNHRGDRCRRPFHPDHVRIPHRDGRPAVSSWDCSIILSERGCPVPRTIHDCDNRAFRFHDGKALALIEFLPGVSVSEPTAAQARAVGAALAQMHVATRDYPAARANTMGLAEWRRLADVCGEAGLRAIDAGLADLVARELALLERDWPRGLPASVIHADLFPDNVLMLDDRVSGLIDFYFACTDITAYDVAVTHAAWCFSGDGRRFDPAISQGLLAGYESVRPLSPGERPPCRCWRAARRCGS
jgi:homoserine kinase type II